MVWVPPTLFYSFGSKNKNKAKISMVYYETILEGILSVQNGITPA